MPIHKTAAPEIITLNRMLIFTPFCSYRRLTRSATFTRFRAGVMLWCPSLGLGEWKRENGLRTLCGFPFGRSPPSSPGRTGRPSHHTVPGRNVRSEKRDTLAVYQARQFWSSNSLISGRFSGFIGAMGAKNQGAQ
jgi:hypothetical protein